MQLLEETLRSVKPKIEFTEIVIGAGSHDTFISCIQLYDVALDASLIKVLDVCRNRHSEFLNVIRNTVKKELHAVEFQC